MVLPSWRTSLWLLLSTVLIPAVLSLSVGILILVFYRAAWDVAFGVLVLCFAVFAVAGSSTTVFLLRRSARLAQIQAEFIANISHDFRTPLTSIRLFVETLRSGRVVEPEERDRCLELLERETGRMERLVQQVLLFRQADHAGETVAPTPQDPAELLERALQPFEIDEQVASRIARQFQGPLPRVLADRDAVVGALRALVDNGLKYGPQEASIEVGLQATSEGAVAFSVQDGGPPIPEKERRHIFRRFYRLKGSGRSGSGLGLAVASEIARAHGGGLELQAAEGGNRFVLTLPTAPGEQA